MTALGRFERGVIVAAAVAVVTIAIGVLVLGAPVAWLLLGLSGALATAALIIQLRHERFFEPMTVIAAVALLSFAIRPLQLFLNVEDLLSWYPAESLQENTLNLDKSETALFVTQKLEGPLEPALTRAIGAVALFLVFVSVGYYLGVGRGIRDRVSRVGSTIERINVRAVVAMCLAIGILGQVVVLVQVGGPAEAFEGQLDSKVLEAGSPVINHFLWGFGFVGVLCWAVWHRPRTAVERAAFAAATLEVAAFSALAGSRTRVFLLLFMLAIVSHYLWRPWRLRVVLGGIVLLFLLGAVLLGVRDATYDQPVDEALKSAPKYVANPRGILNDMTEFDTLFMATSVIPTARDYGYGQGILDAFRSYIPGPLDPNKPESGDQEFRKYVWGDTLNGGRPYTVLGDFYNDFGLPGVVVGAVMFGWAARVLLALIAGPRQLPGWEYRVALYAIGLAILYMSLATTYTIAMGFVLELVIPFLLAVHLLGPLGERMGGAFDVLAGRSKRRTAV